MPDLSNWKVIIVDDEPDNIGVIELVLQFHDAVVKTAESGQECLQLLESERPSMLLIDVQMPGMSGYELLEIIRKDPRWDDIPVIAITAHAMTGDDTRIISAGFDGYIPKPINVMTLIDELNTILEGREKRT